MFIGIVAAVLLYKLREESSTRASKRESTYRACSDFTFVDIHTYIHTYTPVPSPITLSLPAAHERGVNIAVQLCNETKRSYYSTIILV